MSVLQRSVRHGVLPNIFERSKTVSCSDALPTPAATPCSQKEGMSLAGSFRTVNGSADMLPRNVRSVKFRSASGCSAMCVSNSNVFCWHASQTLN
jgi:hypothetical protein